LLLIQKNNPVIIQANNACFNKTETKKIDCIDQNPNFRQKQKNRFLI